MDLDYGQLNVAEVQERTPADYLVQIDSHFVLSDGDQVVLSEPSFPVVELAWQLGRWLSTPGEPLTFEFDSMSFEEIGVVSIARDEGDAWTATSVLAPGISTAPTTWHNARSSVERFVAKVRADLAHEGIPPDDAMPR